MIRISHLEDQPFALLPYKNAAPKNKGVQRNLLPVTAGRWTATTDVDQWLLASDLQGVALSPACGVDVLLGEALAEHAVFASWWPPGFDPARTGVLLAGDLFSAPSADVRGASGDVTDVWDAFAQQFACVVGVAGNHDLFDVPNWKRLRHLDSTCRLLDGDVATVGGLRIGGVSYVAGNPRRPGRIETDTWLGRLRAVVAADVDILVLHEGPTDARGKQGSLFVNDVLDDAGFDGLVVCGHRHWKRPLLDRGHQVVNVDSRALLLRSG